MALNFCVAMGLRLSAIVRNAVCSPAFANSTKWRARPKTDGVEAHLYVEPADAS